MIYAVIGIVLAIVAFVLAAVVDVRVFGEIETLERRLDGEDREMELLLDNISDLTMECARQRERANMLEDKVSELAKLADKINDLRLKVDEIDKRNLDAEKVAQEIIQNAENAAKAVEKQWNDGFQNMLNWNPFDSNETAGGK